MILKMGQRRRVRASTPFQINHTLWRVQNRRPEKTKKAARFRTGNECSHARIERLRHHPSEPVNCPAAELMAIRKSTNAVTPRPGSNV